VEGGTRGPATRRYARAAVAKRKPTSRPRRPAQRRAGPPSGRARGPRPRLPRRDGPGALHRAWGQVRRFGFLIVAVLIIGGGVALGIQQGRNQRDRGFDTTPTRTAPGAFTTSQSENAGKPADEIFADACGTCHTLRAAHGKGVVGPDLDTLALTAQEVRAQIANGSVSGAMPANLLVGEQADRVARYVARVSRASGAARAQR
jgi:mono/diheme cytochrome c family protein